MGKLFNLEWGIPTLIGGLEAVMAISGWENPPLAIVLAVILVLWIIGAIIYHVRKRKHDKPNQIFIPESYNNAVTRGKIKRNNQIRKMIPTTTLLIANIVVIVFNYHPFGLLVNKPTTEPANQVVTSDQIVLDIDNRTLDIALITNNTSGSLYGQCYLVNTSNKTEFYKIKIAIMPLNRLDEISQVDAKGTNPLYSGEKTFFSFNLSYPILHVHDNNQYVFLSRIEFSYSDSYDSLYTHQIPKLFTLRFNGDTKQLISAWDITPEEQAIFLKALKENNYEFY